jgi:gamma-glutamyltranspeptidase/glutathione hydrolase
MHGKFGKLPMRQRARAQHPLCATGLSGERVDRAILEEQIRPGFEALHKEGAIEEIDNMRRAYMPGGKGPAEGEIFKNPDLALTLIEIAEGGRDAFYKGSLAQGDGPLFQADRCAAPL